MVILKLYLKKSSKLYINMFKSKFIKWSDSEIERLIIEKDSSLKELKKLKTIYKNETI